MHRHQSVSGCWRVQRPARQVPAVALQTTELPTLIQNRQEEKLHLCTCQGRTQRTPASMDSFSKYGSSSSSGAGAGRPGAFGGGGGQPDVNVELIKRQAAQQVEMEILGELVKKMSNLCFNKCISRPGDSLGNSEKTCLSNCTDRYTEAFGVVGRAAAQHSAKAMGGMGGM
eukprot:m.28148 g.28148  ORF g.28148 m.28148 type:complete len:171 (+) comp6508_c0_seq1:859-1371(+)